MKIPTIKHSCTLLVACLGGTLFYHQTIAGGIVTDGTLGTPTAISSTLPGSFTIPQSLGQTSADGSSLFHSFTDFNVHLNQTVLLENSSALQRIIMRVTGNSASEINGSLGLQNMQLSNLKDVFLINPKGVIMGGNASINVPGVFHYSNLEILQFSDGSFFSTIDIKGSTLSSAPVSAFGFIEPISKQLNTIPYDPTQELTGGAGIKTFFINHIPKPTPTGIAQPAPITTIQPAPTGITQPIPIDTVLQPPSTGISHPVPVDNVLQLPLTETIQAPQTPKEVFIQTRIEEAAKIVNNKTPEPLVNGFISDTKISPIMVKQDMTNKQNNFIPNNSFTNPSVLFTGDSLIKPNTLIKTNTVSTTNNFTPASIFTESEPPTANLVLKNIATTITDSPQSVVVTKTTDVGKQIIAVNVTGHRQRLILPVEFYPCSLHNSLTRVGKGGIPANEALLGFVPPAFANVSKFVQSVAPLSTTVISSSTLQQGVQFPCVAY